MVLTRATNQPGPDGIVGDNPRTPERRERRRHARAHEHHDVVRRPEPDLHLAPLAPGLPARVRARRRRAARSPPAACSTSTAAEGGIANWAQVKAQARDLLGIELTRRRRAQRAAAGHGPVRPLPARPNGYAQLVTAGTGSSRATRRPTTAAASPPRPRSRTGHAFLDDIAHHAVPFGDHDGNPARRARRSTPTTSTGTADDSTTRPPTTTSCSTRTSSPATAAATRTSASRRSTTSSTPSTTGSSATSRTWCSATAATSRSSTSG